MGRGSSSSGGSSRGGSSSGGSSRGGSSLRSSYGVHRHHHGGYYVGGTIVVRERPGLIVSIIMGAIFACIGVFLGFFGIITYMNSGKYEAVDAVCLYNEYSKGYYYTTYEYIVDGVSYTNRSEVGWEFEEIVGKTVTIYYLKEDPNVITEEKLDNTGALFSSIFGLVFMSVGILSIIMSIRSYRKEKQNEGAGGVSSSTSTTSSQVTCAYCGRLYPNSSRTCPSCGSTNIYWKG